MAARRILVVDDNHDSAESMALLLSLHGHISEARFTGEGLVDYARAFRPDLVLLDIGLPGRSGYDVVRELRADQGLAKIRVAAMSGFDRDADRRAGTQAGFDVHFVKPVDLKELIKLIDGLPG